MTQRSCRVGDTVRHIHNPDDEELQYQYDDGHCEEPVGSCEECGTNLYAEDDFNLCDQCQWRQEQCQDQSPSP